MNIAGHSVTAKQIAALHALYRGLIEMQNGAPTVYGTNVHRQLDALADKRIIARTGMGDYMIPFDGPGAAIISATPDFPIGANL